MPLEWGGLWLPDLSLDSCLISWLYLVFATALSGKFSSWPPYNCLSLGIFSKLRFCYYG